MVKYSMFFGSIGDNNTATYQQYVALDSTQVAKVPDNLKNEQAATIPVGGNTAHTCLYHTTGLNLTPFWKDPQAGSGKSILVMGGSSCVGQYALQFLRLSGFKNIITTGSTKNAQLLKSLGATHVIDRQLSDKEQIDAIRSIEADLTLAMCAVSTDETQFVAYSALSNDKPVKLALTLDKSPSIEKIPKAPGSSAGIVIGSPWAYPELGEPFWNKIGSYLESGKVEPNTPKNVGGFSDIPHALDLIKSGVSAEKLVIVV
jgi:NADPH:quinone reductase-like Zn-dependent oxidoreductase